MGWTPEKPKVRRLTHGWWEVSLEHHGWTERSDFYTWERAMEHALWIGLNAGVWSM